MWALIGTYNYYLYSKDLVWFEDNWPRYLKALDYILSKVIPSGILNATGTGDWGRWKYSTEASSANMLYVLPSASLQNN